MFAHELVEPTSFSAYAYSIAAVLLLFFFSSLANEYLDLNKYE